MEMPVTAGTRYGTVARERTDAGDLPATSPDVASLARRRLAVPAAALALVGVSAVAFATTPHNAAGAVQAFSSSASAPGLTLSATNEYGASAQGASASALYSWQADAVVEPFRTTTLQVSGEASLDLSGAKWEVVEEDAGRVLATGTGGTVEVKFEQAGSWHAVNLAVAGVEEPQSFRVLCKYVRRELRSLTDDDRSRYLAALEAVHRTTTVDGQAMYGSSFRGYEHFVRKHLWRMTLDKCTPFHGGDVFVTAHAALTLELEQALQAVDPRVTAAYWDYSQDSHLYGDEWRTRSPLLTADWFGAFGETAADSATSGAIAAGRFAFLPVPTVDTATTSPDTSFPERNSFGVLTDAMNNNPSPYLTRVDSVCGLPSTSKLPGCTELQGAVSRHDLAGFRAKIEYSFHGQLHMQVGGVDDCARSFADQLEAKPEWAPYLEAAALTLNTMWRSMFNLELLQCPASCAADTAFSECACSCPSLDGRFDNMTFSETYTLLNSKGGEMLGMLSQSSLGKGVLAPDANGTLAFTGLSDEDDKELMSFLLETLCHPGRMSQFATPLAATNDPLFWSTHAMFDRLWSFVRLSPTADGGEFDQTWTSDGSCSMHGADDYLPFQQFAGADAALGSGSGAWTYTNAELVEFFEPTRDGLSFVYDNFDWDHCA